jgi:hypothetical protein
MHVDPEKSMQSQHADDHRPGNSPFSPEIEINAANIDLSAQIDALREILMEHDIIRTILESAEQLQLSNWYLGAGCIVQTVWNHLSGNDPSSHIQDLDFVYFDSNDLSEEGEQRVAECVNRLFAGSPIPFDVRNQSRVHMWYESYFGYPIPPYESLEEAINSWPTTATSIGVTFRQGRMSVYAPYGLHDLFGMIVKPNKVQITKEIYVRKAKRWKKCWPQLTIIAW